MCNELVFLLWSSSLSPKSPEPPWPLTQLHLLRCSDRSGADCKQTLTFGPLRPELWAMWRWSRHVWSSHKLNITSSSRLILSIVQTWTEMLQLRSFNTRRGFTESTLSHGHRADDRSKQVSKMSSDVLGGSQFPHESREFMCNQWNYISSSDWALCYACPEPPEQRMFRLGVENPSQVDNSVSLHTWQ